MQTDEAKFWEFAARYTAAWCSQDPASVAACYSPGGSLTVNGGVPAVGRKAITEVAKSFMSAFPDMRVEMNWLLIEGDRIEYIWTLTGTNTGPGGMGHRVRISGSELWQMGADGLIASSQGRFDEADYQQQLEHGYQEPGPDGPLTPEQEERARLLTADDLRRIDECLLSHASNRFQKMARIVGLTMLDLNHQYHLPDVFFSSRIKHLVESGTLEAAGDLNRMRYSEVRIPGALRSVQ